MGGHSVLAKTLDRYWSIWSSVGSTGFAEHERMEGSVDPELGIRSMQQKAVLGIYSDLHHAPRRYSGIGWYPKDQRWLKIPLRALHHHAFPPGTSSFY